MRLGGHSWRQLLPVAAVLATAAVPGVAVWASVGTAAGQSSYLSGPFTQKTVDRFVHDLGSVGVGVYSPGAGAPVRAVRAPVSPMRLTVDQARAAALGVWSHAGLSGAALDGLAPPVRLTPKLRVPIGVFVAGWAKQVQTPSAALARRILGKVDWRHYKRVVFPQAVLVLFASDVAVQLGGKTHGFRTTSGLASAAVGPCTAVLGFISGTIESVFTAIGHLDLGRLSRSDKPLLDFFAQVVNGGAFLLETGVNFGIDVAHFIFIGGVRVATGFVMSAIAAVAGPIAVVSQIANVLLPWTGKVEASPIPISKGVGTGLPGSFLLTVTALGSNLQWPSAIVDCASPQAFNIPLPSLIPSNATVRWDVSNQDPVGLIVRGSDTGPLDKIGKATLRFETTTESAELAAKGVLQFGVVDAIVTIHRSDLDQLADRLTDAALRILPKAVQDVISPSVHAAIDPLINGVKATIATIRDIQTTGVEVVRYHTPKEENPPPPGQTTKGSGFSLTTGTPALSVDCTGPGQVCSSLEAATRQVVGSSRIRGRTCAGRIESTWSGSVKSEVAGLSPAPTTFVVPAVGKTAPWTAPALNQDYGSGSTVSGYATVTRTGERAVVFRIHLVLDIRRALQQPLHEVEDAAWTGAIVPTSC